MTSKQFENEDAMWEAGPTGRTSSAAPTFTDGHEYRSYCACERCSSVTSRFRAKHERDEAEATGKLAPCPFCGGGAFFNYEGVVHFCVNYGFPSNGVWVECSCGCQLGRGGQTSQEDDTGAYGSWSEAVNAWNSRSQFPTL